MKALFTDSKDDCLETCFYLVSVERVLQHFYGKTELAWFSQLKQDLECLNVIHKLKRNIWNADSPEINNLE